MEVVIKTIEDGIHPFYVTEMRSCAEAFFS